VVTAEAEEEGTAEEEVVYNKRGRTDEEFLRLLDTPRPTREVAEALGITRVGALKRLRALEAKGLVRNTEAGWLAVNGLVSGPPQAPKEEQLKL
jgi:CRP-like cAMP-binding protein